MSDEWSPSVISDYVVLRAATGGKPPVMQALMDFGLHVDHNIDKVGTPLGLAVLCQKADMVRFLLSKGADPNGMYWIPPDVYLVEAASLASPDILNTLLDHGADVADLMALKGAAEGGRIDSAKILLDRGADIDEVFCYDDLIIGTALHVTVQHDQEEFVKFLLARGARRDLRDRNRLTPRELALSDGKEKIAQLLT